MDPLSCLAHESSSLCSFQGTRSNSVAAGDRITKDERIASLWGRALKAEQCSPDEDHDMRDHRLAGDSRRESRATDAEKRRARRSHPALSHKRPGEP